MKLRPKFLHFFSAGILVLTAGLLLPQASAFAQTPAANSGAGPSSSYNWAGYVADSGGYTGVNGSWVIPTIPTTVNLAADATWIGIGGVNGNDLIQTGTQAISNGSSVTYQAWYELLPANSQPISITVNPGDSITASIVESAPGQWTVSLRDNTNGQNFQTVTPYSSSMSSAEWIEEMPSQGNGGFIPLDNFGSVQFTQGSAVQNGQTLSIAQSGAQSITMLNRSNQDLATPSALGPDGGSFSVNRSSGAASSPTTTLPYGRRGWGRVGVGINGFNPIPGSVHRRGFSRMNNFRLFTRFSFNR